MWFFIKTDAKVERAGLGYYLGVLENNDKVANKDMLMVSNIWEFCIPFSQSVMQIVCIDCMVFRGGIFKFLCKTRIPTFFFALQ